MSGPETHVRRTLWILAHPDDELLALHLVDNFLDSINFVIYLTDGVRSGALYSAKQRQQEAETSWKLIAQNHSLSFFGAENHISDGRLAADFSEIHFKSLFELAKASKPDRVVTLDFEGGHQDHDETSLIASFIAAKLNSELILFPAYRAANSRLPLYYVMSVGKNTPLPIRLDLHRRVALAVLSVRLMGRYRSQKSTWLGLGSFVVSKYLFGRLGVYRENDPVKLSLKLPKNFLYVNRKKSKLLDYAQISQNLAAWSNNLE